MSSTYEAVVVQICLVLLLSVHVLGVVVVSCCVLRMCVLNWHKHGFYIVPPWPNMTWRLMTFLKCLCSGR